ncbi:MAG: UMP kinase [Phycisphaerae bacterium]|nr:UMP kinase [Phycisphaerae bacterium]
MTKTNAKYKRVLVKLSGEALCGRCEKGENGGSGIDPAAVKTIANELAAVAQTGVKVGVVVGAGNFIRGRDLANTPDIENITADYMGMVATIINALALRDTICSCGVKSEVFSAIPTPLVCEPYYRPRVLESLEQGSVVIFAGGTSHPGVTTDMCAAIRANEIGADILLKATKVDGVYDSDPAVNPDAKKYESLTYEQAIAEKLGVMDLPAMAFSMDCDIPMMVFNMSVAGNLAAAANGKKIGTMVTRK